MKALFCGRMLATLGIASLAGIYLGDVVGVAHARASLDAGSFVQMQQAIHVRFVRMMPPLILACVLGHGLWLWALRKQAGSIQFRLVLLALLGVIASAAMTRWINVPLNQALMSWSAASPPSNLHQLWQPWERVNLLRLAASVFGLVVDLALLAGSGDGRHAGSGLDQEGLDRPS